MRLKVTAEGGWSFEVSLQITYIVDCRPKFVDTPVITIKQRQRKLKLTKDDLDIALDKENCPVEAISLLEE